MDQGVRRKLYLRREMGFELCFDLVAHLLDYHVLCPDDKKRTFVDKNFKYSVIGYVNVPGTWIR